MEIAEFEEAEMASVVPKVNVGVFMFKALPELMVSVSELPMLIASPEPLADQVTLPVEELALKV